MILEPKGVDVKIHDMYIGIVKNVNTWYVKWFSAHGTERGA